MVVDPHKVKSKPAMTLDCENFSLYSVTEPLINSISSLIFVQSAACCMCAKSAGNTHDQDRNITVTDAAMCIITIKNMSKCAIYKCESENVSWLQKIISEFVF